MTPKDDDHDLLIEIKTIVSNNGLRLSDFMLETRRILAKHDKDIDFINKLIYGFIGVFVFIEFIFKVIK